MRFDINVENSELIDPETMVYGEWKKDREERLLIYYIYKIDRPEKVENQLVKEYPNGGRDYIPIVVEPEEGHFEIEYEDGRPFPYSVDIPTGISKDIPVPDVVEMVYWRKLTSSELVDKKEKEEAEEAKQEEERTKAEAQQVFLETAPSELKGMKETQDDIVLMLADIVGGAV